MPFRAANRATASTSAYLFYGAGPLGAFFSLPTYSSFHTILVTAYIHVCEPSSASYIRPSWYFPQRTIDLFSRISARVYKDKGESKDPKDFTIATDFWTISETTSTTNFPGSWLRTGRRDHRSQVRKAQKAHCAISEALGFCIQ